MILIEWEEWSRRKTDQNIFARQLLYFILIQFSSEPLITVAFPKIIFPKGRFYVTRAHKGVVLVPLGCCKKIITDWVTYKQQKLFLTVVEAAVQDQRASEVEF